MSMLDVENKIEAQSNDEIIRWLTNETRDERFMENIFAALCNRLQTTGLPLKRASLHLQIQHPQWLGGRITWSDGMQVAEIVRVDHEVRGRAEYIGSPAQEIHDGALAWCAKISNAIRHRAAGTPSLTNYGAPTLILRTCLVCCQFCR
jgi:hypothetical protein